MMDRMYSPVFRSERSRVVVGLARRVNVLMLAPVRSYICIFWGVDWRVGASMFRRSDVGLGYIL